MLETMTATMWLKNFTIQQNLILYAYIVARTNHTQIRTITGPSVIRVRINQLLRKKLSGYYVLGLMHTPYFDIVVTAIHS